MEFIGKARVLRDRVAKAHDQWTKAAEQLTAPLLPRDGFTPVFTKGMLSITAARWLKLPEWGRLRPVAHTNDRDGRLALGELRLIPFRTIMETWTEDELAIALALVSVAMARAPSTFNFDSQLLAIIGLHALARRFERGADPARSRGVARPAAGRTDGARHPFARRRVRDRSLGRRAVDRQQDGLRRAAGRRHPDVRRVTDLDASRPEGGDMPQRMSAHDRNVIRRAK